RPARPGRHPVGVLVPSEVPGRVRRLRGHRPGAVRRRRGPTGRMPAPHGPGRGRRTGLAVSRPAEATGSVAHAGETPVLEVRDVHVNFAGRVGLFAGLAGKKAADAKAVDGVDFTLAPGEVVALAGESGCGKTTLARAIMGLVKPEKGQILFRG